MALKDYISPQHNAARLGFAIADGFADNASSGAISGLSGGAGDQLISVSLIATIGNAANRTLSAVSCSIKNNRIKLVTGASATNGAIAVMWWKGDPQVK